MILEERNPVLHKGINQAAAEVAGQAHSVKGSCQAGCQNSMDGIEERSHKQEGEFQRLCDAAEHSGDGSGNQERCRLFLLLGTGAHVDGQSRTGQAENLGIAVEGKAALREKVAEALTADSEIIEVLQPVSLDAAVADSGAEDERQVDEVMETCGQKDSL